MFAKTRDKIREKVHNLQYVMTIHAEEEMENDDLSILDVESGVLTGEIIDRQRDSETGEWKYLISGKTIGGENIIIVSKLSVTDKLIISTVYLEDYEFKN